MKRDRSRPSFTVHHDSRAHKHSPANQNETGVLNRHSSTNIHALRDGNGSPCSTNSQVGPNAQMDGQHTNHSGLDAEPNISAKTQNNSDFNEAKPGVKHSLSSRHGNKDSALTSPQKHREKRKHCGSADSHKHKKRKHSRDARFEGHRISHLVKQKAYKKTESDDNEAPDQKKSDDYVLAKLFKKSGTFFYTVTN